MKTGLFVRSVSATAGVVVCMNVQAGAQDGAQGWAEEARLTLHNRVVYEQLDYKHGQATRTVAGDRSDVAKERAYGAMLNFSSGYSSGLIGIGLDAHAYGGLNLGSHADSVRSNPRFLAKQDMDLKDHFGRLGAALKLRVSSTELKYGEQRTKNPIFQASDSRLLPETNRGWQLSSTDIPTLSLQAGYFNKWTDRTARKNGAELLSNYAMLNAKSFSFAGGTWTTPVKNLSLSSYWGRYHDVWNTWYLGSYYRHALTAQQSASLSLNLYRNTDTGRALAGEVDNTTWSLMAGYGIGPHQFGLGYQKVDGNTPFDYVNRGSIWLENAMQLSDFNAPHEASWQLKYDVDLGQLIAPGLSAGIAYTRGSKIDYRRAGPVYGAALGLDGSGGKHWERDMVVKYTVQSGQAKGLALLLRWSVHRANAEQGEFNVNQFRVQADFPISLL